MKKIITTAVAASMLLGSTSSAISAQALDRDAAFVSESEEVEGGSGILIAILAAAAVIVGIILIEKDQDEDLPTSP